MIVVEGPDGSGKTSLIKEIRMWFDLDLMPRVVSKQAQAMVDLKEWVEDDNLHKGKFNDRRSLYDRHRLISEPIYGPILRPGMPEPGFGDPHWLADQTQAFYERHPYIIYCLPPIGVVSQNVRDSGEENAVISPKDSDRIWQMYLSRAAIDRYITPTYIFNYLDDEYERLYTNLAFYLRFGVNHE